MNIQRFSNIDLWVGTFGINSMTFLLSAAVFLLVSALHSSSRRVGHPSHGPTISPLRCHTAAEVCLPAPLQHYS